jgi:hypothetical protein
MKYYMQLITVLLGLTVLFVMGCTKPELEIANTIDRPTMTQEPTTPATSGVVVKKENRAAFSTIIDNSAVNIFNNQGHLVDSPKVNVVTKKITTTTNKEATVQIIVLENLYKWKIGSMTKIARTTGGNGTSFTVAQYIDGLRRRVSGDSTQPIIALGLASHEFERGHRTEWEEDRAGMRADNLGQACREKFDAPIYTMNLGVHETTSSNVEESADERRVVLVVVTSGNALTDQELEESIHRVLPDYKEQLRFNPDVYSLWPEKSKVIAASAS